MSYMHCMWFSELLLHVVVIWGKFCGAQLDSVWVRFEQNAEFAPEVVSEHSRTVATSRLHKQLLSGSGKVEAASRLHKEKNHRNALRKKRDYVGKFPNEPPPPHAPVWERPVIKKIWFILHFWASQKITILGDKLKLCCGNRWPPPPQRRPFSPFSEKKRNIFKC